MSARRGSTDLSGILVLDKPAGMTSHDVVDRVRRATGERRVGHAGTLDPAATGVLVMLVGPAARLATHLTAAEKTYEARILFGAETDTDDADGAILATAHVPDEVGDPFFASGTVASLVGVHQQVPPAYSAIKQNGRTAHRAARSGDALELGARTIEVTAARLVGVEIDPPAWDVALTVSKGTYIRALARDLGRALSTCAHLGGLRRTRSGMLSLTEAHTLEELAAADDVSTLFCDPVAALGMAAFQVDDAGVADVKNGKPLPAAFADVEDAADGAPIAICHGGRLVALYTIDGSAAKPLVVIPGGVSGGNR